MKRNQNETPQEQSAADMEQKALEERIKQALYEGQRLLGPNGALTGMLQKVINSAMEGELNNHLEESKASGESNRRNGKLRKRVRSEGGEIEIITPRDRDGSFQPQIVEKWGRTVNTGLNEHILSLYSLGNSVSDIQYHIKQIYGLDYSAGLISSVTDSVLPELLDWQQRTLSSFYSVVYIDGVHFKTREEGHSKSKIIYSIYGVTAEGKREVLGLYTRDSEGANDWGLVLMDIQRRGVEDVLFFCFDGLAGLSGAISKVYPKSSLQRCIVHMIRNSIKFVSSKDVRAICADLRKIYTASDVGQARLALEVFIQKWPKYPRIGDIWTTAWEDIITFLNYGTEIRKMIYTTNPVESLHSEIRRITKTKGSFCNEKALLKQVFTSIIYGKGEWQRNVSGWKVISVELEQKYGERYTKHL
jgi:putative transposase